MRPPLYPALLAKGRWVNDCFEWQGLRFRGGYGKYFWQGSYRGVHRLMAQELGWPIEGSHVCHTCDNPSCFSPWHLFVGTHKENIQDAARKGRLTNHNRLKTHCPQGHPYDGVNSSGGRICCTCRALYMHEYHLRRKGSSNV